VLFNIVILSIVEFPSELAKPVPTPEPVPFISEGPLVEEEEEDTFALIFEFKI
jgi:hypothetical protein